MIWEGFLIGLGIFAAYAVLSVLPFLMIFVWAFRKPLLLVGLVAVIAALTLIGGSVR